MPLHIRICCACTAIDTAFSWCTGLVVVDKAYLASKWAMWELHIIILAYCSSVRKFQTRSQQTQPRRSLLPVFLLDVKQVEPTFHEHWGDLRKVVASDRPVATPDDIKRLCSFAGIRADQVRSDSCWLHATALCAVDFTSYSSCSSRCVLDWLLSACVLMHQHNFYRQTIQLAHCVNTP